MVDVAEVDGFFSSLEPAEQPVSARTPASSNRYFLFIRMIVLSNIDLITFCFIRQTKQMLWHFMKSIASIPSYMTKDYRKI